jgi:hypothetical protein
MAAVSAGKRMDMMSIVFPRVAAGRSSPSSLTGTMGCRVGRITFANTPHNVGDFNARASADIAAEARDLERRSQREVGD